MKLSYGRNVQLLKAWRLLVCVWGQITMCDWQLYQAKPQAWPSDPSARVAAFASRCEGLGWAMVWIGVHFAHTISKSMDLNDKTKCKKRLVARQGIWMETSTAIPVVERHIARTHTHAEPCNCYFDFTCRNVWAQAIWWKRIGKPEENIFRLPLPGCHWLTLHALFCRRFYWKTKGLPHFQLEGWARYFVLNLSKLCMFPTCVCSACDKPAAWNLARVKGEWLNQAKGENHRKWLENRKATWKMASCNATIWDIFFPFECGGPCQSCDNWNWNWFEHVMPSGHPCSGTQQGVPKIVAWNGHQFLWPTISGAFWTVDCRLVMTCHDVIPCLLMFVNRFTMVHLDLYCERSWHTRKKLWNWQGRLCAKWWWNQRTRLRDHRKLLRVSLPNGKEAKRVSAGHSKRWESRVFSRK